MFYSKRFGSRIGSFAWLTRKTFAWLTLAHGTRPRRALRALLSRLEQFLKSPLMARETDLLSDKHVAFAAGVSRKAIIWEQISADKVDSPTSAARFVIDLLRSRSDIRDRFPFALSDGVEGEFVKWLKEGALEDLGGAGSAKANVIAAYELGLAAKAKQAVLFEYSLRTNEPLLFLPAGRSSLIKALFNAVKASALPPEAAWWCLIELAERPELALIFTWQHTPSWQEKFPNGITRFGRRDFAAWIRASFPVDRQALDASQWPEVLDPADQIRLAYNTSTIWRTSFPDATTNRDACIAFLTYLASEKSDVEESLREWLLLIDRQCIVDRVVRPGVNVFGHFSYPSGLRASAQLIIESLRTANFDFSLINVPVGLATDECEGSMFSGPEVFDISIVHVEPEPFFEVVRQRANVMDRKPRPYQIGYWYWELDTIPPSWDSAAQQCDEIWTATQFIADALRARYSMPVHVFMPGIELPEFGHLPRSHYGLPEDEFIFLFNFHMSSTLERKNPLGLIRAFKQAFNQDDRAMLVIKILYGSQHPREKKKLLTEAQGANILIIDEVYSKEETLNLMRVSDAYVSLHRSEGLGLTMAEAMLLGRPTIATRYSGNMDFMNDDNSLLVHFEYKFLKKDYPPYPAGCRWAEPSVEQAAHYMYKLYADRDFGRELGLRAQADIQRRLSHSESGKRMADRLLEITRSGMGHRF